MQIYRKKGEIRKYGIKKKFIWRVLVRGMSWGDTCF